MTKPARAGTRRSSSSTASARTNPCGGRSSSISAPSAARSRSIIPAMATATRAPEGTTRDDYAAAILVGDDASSASTARTSAASRSAASSPSPCTTPGPKRMRLADPRRHLRRAPRRPRDLRTLARRQRRTCACWPKPRRRAARPAGRSRQCAAKWSRRWRGSIPPPTASAPKPSGSPTSASAPRRSACRRWSLRQPRTGLPRPRSRRRSPDSSPVRNYEMIERAGHFRNLERPDAFNTLVRAFIAGVDRALNSHCPTGALLCHAAACAASVLRVRASSMRPHCALRV